MASEPTSGQALAAELPSFDLTGKKAFVTGSSRGIGRAIALALAHAGADVALNCRTVGGAVEEVVSLIRGMGRKVEVYTGDVGDEAKVASMCDAIRRDFGPIDVLVNNAAINRDSTFKKMTRDLWDQVITADLTSVYLVTKQFIDDMAGRGWGRVINMSSITGVAGNFGQANYAAAKAGMIGFSKTLAREYARKGVTVNVIAPGFIHTQMTDGIPEKAKNAVVAATPVHRMGDPAEIAAGVVYLAAPSSGFITGHVLDINGGYVM